MKKILLLILFSLCSTLVGQAREELNYYPLHVRDVWQYKIRYFPETGKDTIFYLTKSVKRDTVLSNGRKYFIVEQPPFTWKRFKTNERVLIRIDSSSGSVLKYDMINLTEYQVDSMYIDNEEARFQAKINDYRNFFTAGYSPTKEVLVFNKLHRVKTLSGPIMSGAGFYWRLALDLGVYYGENSSAVVTAAGNIYELVYAKINGKEYGTYVSVEDEEKIPTQFSLSQNYPNPFNPETTISYKVHAASKVSLKVYDLLGREVAILVNEFKQPGSYKVRFNVETRQGVSLQSGVYFFRLQAGSFSETKKMILLK